MCFTHICDVPGVPMMLVHSSVASGETALRSVDFSNMGDGMGIDFSLKRQELLAELTTAEKRRQEISLAEMMGQKSSAEVKLAADAVRDIQERLADLGAAETLHEGQRRVAEQVEQLEQRRADAATARTLIEVRHLAAAEIDQVFATLGVAVEKLRSAENHLGGIFMRWTDNSTLRQQENAQGVNGALNARDMFPWVLGALERAGVPTDRPTHAQFMDGVDFATYIAGRNVRLRSWGKRLIPELGDGAEQP